MTHSPTIPPLLPGHHPKDSAFALGDALRYNKALKHLDVCHNAFSDIPAQQFADAIAMNEALTYINLSYNTITPAAAMVLGNSLKKNKGLTEIVLDGNRLGKRGGEALMTAVTRSQTAERFISLSLRNCDLEFLDTSASAFNPMEPTVRTQLVLSRPYDVMVASELLRLANTRFGCRFSSLEFRPNNGKKFEKINLYRADAPATSQDKTWQSLVGHLLDVIKNRKKPFERPDLPQKLMDCFESIGMSPLDKVIDHTLSRLHAAFNDGKLDLGHDRGSRRVAAYKEMETQIVANSLQDERTLFEGGLGKLAIDWGTPDDEAQRRKGILATGEKDMDPTSPSSRGLNQANSRGVIGRSGSRGKDKPSTPKGSDNASEKAWAEAQEAAGQSPQEEMQSFMEVSVGTRRNKIDREHEYGSS